MQVKGGWARESYVFAVSWGRSFEFPPSWNFVTCKTNGTNQVKIKALALNLRWSVARLCWSVVHLSENSMDHFAMLAPYIIYCTVLVTISRNVLLRIHGTLCGPLEIPGRPPMVHLDHVDNHQINCLLTSETCAQNLCRTRWKRDLFTSGKGINRALTNAAPKIFRTVPKNPYFT